MAGVSRREGGRVDDRDAVVSGVFVTGATGTVGSAVVTHLLDRGQQVLAGVRSPADVARLPTGAEGGLFDFGAPARDLEQALVGADWLYRVDRGQGVGRPGVVGHQGPLVRSGSAWLGALVGGEQDWPSRFQSSWVLVSRRLATARADIARGQPV